MIDRVRRFFMWIYSQDALFVVMRRHVKTPVETAAAYAELILTATSGELDRIETLARRYDAGEMES